MINYNIVIALIYIIVNILGILLVFLTYKPTKAIVIKNIEKELKSFHCKYLQNNYRLEVANLNGFESIDKAILEIEDEPDLYSEIPSEDIFFTSCFLNWLRNYSLYQKRVFYLICFGIFVISAIKCALNFI